MSNFTVEIESPVAAARMFRAAALDWHNLGPKLVPEVISSGVALEGEGGAGSIRQINFTSAMPFSYLKERLDFVDNDKLECKSTIVEGFDLGKILKSASAHFKFEPTSSGGSVCKVEASYETLPGVPDAPAEVAKAKESTIAQLKAVEAHLIANPAAYA